jgi:hypothetical protein
MDISQLDKKEIGIEVEEKIINIKFEGQLEVSAQEITTQIYGSTKNRMPYSSKFWEIYRLNTCLLNNTLEESN